ncbi:MAG: hypothetical protein ABJG15_15185 [Hyphomonadaceae bacterium]
MILASLSILAFLVSLVLCRLVMAIAPKDAPDGGRKTQTIAIPTSGGIAIGSAIGIVWIAFLMLSPQLIHASGFEQKSIGNGALFSDGKGHALISLSLAVLLIGALDDRYAVPTKPKFAALAIASLLAGMFGAYVDGIFFPVADAYFPLATWLGIGGTGIWLFVMMNATNFMDGSNGLAMGTLAIMLCGLAAYFHIESTHFSGLLAGLATLTIAAILGFMFWNLQSKLYAGDAGSLSGGAMFAGLGIYAAQDGNIWFPATLALPFLVDVFMTLIWRAKQGHNLLTPHRHHAYQLFIRSGWGHIRTALLWWGLSGICAVAALWAAGDSKSTSAFVFLGMLALGCVLWVLQRLATGLTPQNG